MSINPLVLSLTSIFPLHPPLPLSLSTFSPPLISWLSPHPPPLADILLNLSDVAPDLQNSISRLCERWWTKNGEGEAEDLVPHTLLYLVARTLADGATVSQLKQTDLTCTHVPKHFHLCGSHPDSKQPAVNLAYVSSSTVFTVLHVITHSHTPALWPSSTVVDAPGFSPPGLWRC